MIEMPRHEENVTFEDAIRALELVHSYVALEPRVATKARRQKLHGCTSRSMICHIANPIFGTPADELRRVIRQHILPDLVARPKSSDSDKVGVADLRCTLQAYVDGK